MSYLLDTNVVSEIARARPEPKVVRWFQSVPDSGLFLSVIAIGEIRKGIERLPYGSRREALRLWLERDVPSWFENRLLPVDVGVADRWGRLMAAAGRTLPAADSLIAATALHHGLRVVTRNETDFDFPEVQVVNPWRL